MGRKNRGGQKRGRTMRKHFKDGRENVWKKTRTEGDTTTTTNNNATWEPFVMENPLFEDYYKEQGILSENEWDTFLATLKSPLPAVFRVNSSGQFAMAVKDRIQQEFVEARKADSEVDGSVVDLIKPISWYPEKLAWQLNFSRMQLRKNQKLAQIHEFLKQENETGIITRQEAVSMLPPLLLDVQPHHHILDMCAAPGSKTFQLLEMIHQKGLISEGLVIANDLDVQRCHLLVHQTKRMCSPNAIVTNHEAQHFPLLKKKKHVQLLQDDMVETINVKDEDRGLLFDRVLCDVPCSGDGTIRKAPDIWKKWNSGIGNGLHRLQVQITLRGVALLKVGGRIVYSTCSLNPVEDEAVVAEVLRRTEGCLELLDVSQELPSLKFRPGLKTWKVKDRGQWLVSYRQVNKHRAMSIVPGMFPSGQRTDETASRPKEIPNSDKDLMPTEELTKESGEQSVTDVLEESSPQAIVEETEVSTLPLERCMRILPHDQDTGGFFIAVFKKIKPWSVEQKPAELSVPKQIGNRIHSAGEANEFSLKSDCPDSNTASANEVSLKSDCPDSNTASADEISLKSDCPDSNTASANEISLKSDCPDSNTASGNEISLKSDYPDSNTASVNEISLKSDCPDSNTASANDASLQSDCPNSNAACAIEISLKSDCPDSNTASANEVSLKSYCPDSNTASATEISLKSDCPDSNTASANEVSLKSDCLDSNTASAEGSLLIDPEHEDAEAACMVEKTALIDTETIDMDIGVENIESNCEEKQQPEASVKEENQKQSDPSINGGSDGLKKDPGQKLQSKTQQQGNWKGVDPVIILSDEEIIRSLIDFYGIHEDFNIRGRLVTRSDDTKRVKRIYHISEPVRDVILRNYMSGDQLKIVSVGLKLFERQAGKEDFSPCLFRLSSEGLPIILPHLTKQVAVASKAVFELILSNRVVSFTSFNDDNFSAAIKALSPGCCVIILDSQSIMNVSNSKPEQSIAIGCWRGRNNLSLLVSKVEAEQLLQKLGCKKEDTSKSPEDAVMATESEEELKEAAVDKDREEASEVGDPDEVGDGEILSKES